MKSSSAQPNKAAKFQSDLDLEFPVEPSFISRTHPMTADEMFRHNQQLIIEFNSRPDAEELRLRTKCDVEFVL